MVFRPEEFGLEVSAVVVRPEDFGLEASAVVDRPEELGLRFSEVRQDASGFETSSLRPVDGTEAASLLLAPPTLSSRRTADTRNAVRSDLSLPASEASAFTELPLTKSITVGPYIELRVAFRVGISEIDEL